MNPAIVRWVLFILIGYPFHLITMAVYPLLHLYWRVFVFKRVDNKAIPVHEDPTVQPRHSAIRDGVFHDNQDDHSALTHWGLFLTDIQGFNGLDLLIGSDGNFLRRFRSGNEEGFHVSGDAVINWCFATALFENKFTGGPSLNQFAARHYLKNLGTLSNQPQAEGWVSARCNNFGINYCPDSDVKIGQPCAGPQFYTNSSLFALASQGSLWWKFVFWMHWIFMGGWMWAFSPLLYTKNWKGWYVRDTTMKALFVHLLVFGPRWWITKPMRFIADKISEHENELFRAMMGRESVSKLPTVMNPFFSQDDSAVSKDDEKANVWIKPGLDYIRELAKGKSS